jgi:predicted SAM-dependent methyltransferase
MRLKMLTAPDSREALAVQYLRGKGIEIGALHQPLRVPEGAEVVYVDRLPIGELRRQYPELRENELTPVDVVDNGETLGKFQDGALDFVIANHFLEHCENPIGAVEAFLRVLKPGGIVYLAVPDKRFTFDSNRPVTGLQHLIRDYREGPGWSREEHFKDWRALAEDKFRDDPARSMETLKDGSYSIHFHVWTFAEVLELIMYLKRDLRLVFEPEKIICGKSEMIVVLRKA